MADKKSKNAPEEGAKEIYDRLVTDRDPYTQRAEKNAQYTIPSLFPKESDDGGTNYETPYDSIGARGVNNLASKLLLSLLPPNQPFFKLGLDPDSQQKLDNLSDPETVTDIEYGLSQIEQLMMRYMESQSLRATMFEAIKQLIIAGNALLFLPPKEGGMKCYGLRNYVVERDGLGNVIQIVAKDTLARATLPEALLGMLEDKEGQPNQKVDIYTHIYRVQGNEGDGTWETYQELNKEVISGSEQSYPFGKSPWIPCRFFKKDGESYGRSFVEDYIGDLVSLHNLSKSIVDGSMIAAKILFLVNPASMTSINQLSKASNGDFVKGKIDDVVPMQLNKSTDLQYTSTVQQQIEQRLNFVFLLNSAVQRQAERVTAEEIRYTAQELETTLGGVYSLLSLELQLPLVGCVYNQMQSQKLIPEVESLGVDLEPTITTGLDALGRGADFQKLQQVLGVMQNFPEFMQTLNVGNLSTRLFTAIGLSYEGLVKTPEELQAEQQQAMDQQGELMGMQGAVDAQVAKAKNEG